MEGYTEVFAWGGDHFGQLGLGGKTTGKTYSSPRFCSFNILIKEISCGEEHAGFISYSGHIYTMGSNSEGRLGIGSSNIKQSPSPCLVEDLVNYSCIKISCGWGHTAVVTSIGEVFAWGLGEYGALGNGSIDTKWSPILMPNIKGNAVDLSCGSRHTGIIIIDRSGKRQVAMCGGGEAGQLGTGRREKELYPTVLDFPEEIEQVACGVFHSAILTIKGSVYTMGGNSFGQLGLGHKKSQSKPEKVNLENVFIKKIRCSNYTAAVSDKGHLYLWGSGVFGEHLFPHRLSFREPIVDFSIGSGFGIAIDSSYSVHVWGGNSNGELGLDDYDQRLNPTVLQSLKGKNVLKIACGGNFCLGLGNDVVNRVKTPERTRKNVGEYRHSEEITENWGKKRVNEVEKLSYEVKQTYKSYEEIKKNFENLSEKYEIDKRNSEKHAEELFRENSRHKQEIEHLKAQREIDDREIRELTHCVDELKRVNYDYTSEIRIYKEELNKLKRKSEENKQLSRLELKNLDDRRTQGFLDLEEKLSFELSKRKQLEKDLERLNSMVYCYEDTIRSCQKEINEAGAELSSVSSDKKKLQSEVEKLYKEVHDLTKKNEFLLNEKEKVQNVLKNEIEKYFNENKDLKYDLEISKEQINELSIEALDRQKLAKDFNEIKWKYDSALIEIKNYESLRADFNRLKGENVEYLDKIENLYRECEKMQIVFENENQKLNSDNFALQKQVEKNSYELLQMEKVKNDIVSEKDSKSRENYELLQRLEKETEKTRTFTIENERINREKSSLEKQINYLISDKEKVTASLSAEIEDLSNEKYLLIQRNEQLFVEKEKKTTSLSSEIAKFSTENFELKQKIDGVMIEKEKVYADLSKLSDDLTDLRKQYETLSSENRFTSQKLKETLQESSDTKTKLSYSLSDKENTIQKQNSEIESLIKSVSEYKKIVEILNQERENLNANHLIENTSKSSEISKLQSQIHLFEKETSSLSQTLCEKSENLSNYQNQCKVLVLENSTLKQNIEELNYKIENLSQINSEQEYLYKNAKETGLDWEQKCYQLEEEITRLKYEIIDLENKNRQLFENLEKELSQRAKEYKERTLSILSTPMRSGSPYLRPPTPGDEKVRNLNYNRTHTPVEIHERTRGLDDFKGNTAAKLLNTLEESPGRKASFKANAKTPTKEDIRNKIASLMQNRNRIENDLIKLEE